MVVAVVGTTEFHQAVDESVVEQAGMSASEDNREYVKEDESESAVAIHQRECPE